MYYVERCGWDYDDEEYLHWRLCHLKIMNWAIPLEKIKMEMKNYHVWVWIYVLHREVENTVLQDYTLVARYNVFCSFPTLIMC